MKWRSAELSASVGSSFQGLVETTYADLVSLFGSPWPWPHEKSAAEWVIIFEDGTVADIYDYHQDSFPTPVQDIRKWHVAGHSPLAVQRVLEHL